MAAAGVILKNLEGTLARVENRWQLSSMNLSNLSESLREIRGAVAELIVVKDHSISDDLKKLVALLHQADDLVDEVLARTDDRNVSRAEGQDRDGNQGGNLGLGLQRVVNASNRVVQKVSSLFPYPCRLFMIARKIDKVGEEIKKLGMQMQNKFSNVLDLQFVPLGDTYNLAEKKVIGREKEKSYYIDKLLQPMTDNETTFSVIPIIGTRGMGKSALAQVVYDDEKVKGHFDLRMWVQVSNMTGIQIIQEIAESCTYRSSNKIPKPAKTLHSRVHQNRLKFRSLLGCQNVDTTQTTTPSHSHDSKNKTNIYERRLQREIEGKLYLLILDDVCDKYEVYSQRLKEVLARGARGSRILVTTRSDKVADYVRYGKSKSVEEADYGNLEDEVCSQRLKGVLARGARGSQILVTTRSDKVADYVRYGKSKSVEEADYGNLEDDKLKGLTDDDPWSLFKYFAFRQGNQRDDDMEKIGRAIAKNCQGVPLTIKVAASLLHGKRKEDWLSFNAQLTDMNQNEDIMERVLHISYRNLPTRLKACFVYCYLFPDDYTFNRKDLLSLWIAQGFIERKDNQTWEEAAGIYFLELSRLCFFEDAITDDLKNVVACKMHPIMRNLAQQYAAGIVPLCGADDSEINLDSKHVSFTCDESSLTKISSSKLESQRLQTLLSVNEPNADTKIGTLLSNMLISSFDSIKVLELHNLGVEYLPESIGKLIHLRYLDLSKNDDLTTLPKSVADLYNLHTLKLNSCTKLETILCNFGELGNLGRFEIDECDSLTSMPQGLEKLTNLETLSRFVVGDDFSKDMATVGLKALKDLKNLRGRLAIEFTGDWTAIIPEAASAELSNKEHLEELKISWAKTVSNVEKVSHKLSDEERYPYKQLLEQLNPNQKLRILCIEGYRGGDFPEWAGVNTLANSLKNIAVISIEGCEKCKHLPPFGELPYLKRLTLRHMVNVQYVEGQTSSKSTFFPLLEELTLHNFYDLVGWRKEETLLPDMILHSKKLPKQEPVRSFPRLTKLLIWNCPNLRSMPLFTKVTNLNLCNVNQELLEDSAKKIPLASQQQDDKPSGIEQQNDKPSGIQQLQIKGCPGLESFEVVRKGLGKVSTLKHLVVERCHALTFLASELEHLASLERLEISSCRKLNLSDNGSSTTDNIRAKSWIPSRIAHPFSGTSKTVTNPWTSLKCLRQLILQDIPNMKTLPEGLNHVQNLRSLWISACPALTELPEWIGNLTKLQHLHIESCRQVTKLPEGIQKIISLMKVEIIECPELMERCREHTGEDWYKIKHAQVLLHKSWRYGLMSELEASQSRSNVRALTDVKYFIVPLASAEAVDLTIRYK